jgi:hypothetical protein
MGVAYYTFLERCVKELPDNFSVCSLEISEKEGIKIEGLRPRDIISTINDGYRGRAVAHVKD